MIDERPGHAVVIGRTGFRANSHSRPTNFSLGYEAEPSVSLLLPFTDRTDNRTETSIDPTGPLHQPRVTAAYPLRYRQAIYFALMARGKAIEG